MLLVCFMIGLNLFSAAKVLIFMLWQAISEENLPKDAEYADRLIIFVYQTIKEYDEIQTFICNLGVGFLPGSM